MSKGRHPFSKAVLVHDLIGFPQLTSKIFISKNPFNKVIHDGLKRRTWAWNKRYEIRNKEQRQRMDRINNEIARGGVWL